MGLMLRQAVVLVGFVATIVASIFMAEQLRAVVPEAGWLLHASWIGLAALSLVVLPKGDPARTWIDPVRRLVVWGGCSWRRTSGILGVMACFMLAARAAAISGVHPFAIRCIGVDKVEATSWLGVRQTRSADSRGVADIRVWLPFGSERRAVERVQCFSDTELAVGPFFKDGWKCAIKPPHGPPVVLEPSGSKPPAMRLSQWESFGAAAFLRLRAATKESESWLRVPIGGGPVIAGHLSLSSNLVVIKLRGSTESNRIRSGDFVAVRGQQGDPWLHTSGSGVLLGGFPSEAHVFCVVKESAGSDNALYFGDAIRLRHVPEDAREAGWQPYCGADAGPAPWALLPVQGGVVRFMSAGSYPAGAKESDWTPTLMIEPPLPDNAIW